MPWAKKIDGVWQELDPTGFTLTSTVDADEPYEDAIQYPGNWPDLASDEDRAALGIMAIADPELVPPGERAIGTTIVGEDAPQRAWVTEVIPLAELRANLTAQVNAGAGAFRSRFITDIPGQQATYLAKEQEAIAWTADADPADFPYLANEAADTGQSIASIAQLVLGTATAWRGLDPRIEGKRRGATVAIAAATTAEAIIAAGTVDWNALLG